MPCELYQRSRSILSLDEVYSPRMCAHPMMMMMITTTTTTVIERERDESSQVGQIHGSHSGHYVSSLAPGVAEDGDSDCDGDGHICIRSFDHVSYTISH